MSSIKIELKPTYEIPLSGVIGAGAQGAFVSGKIAKPFRINGIVIVFGSDHIDAVLHYFLAGDTNQVSTTSISTGDNLIPSGSPTPYFIGHNMIRHIKIIKEFPEGNRYLKCHVVNNNAYAITANASLIVEEI